MIVLNNVSNVANVRRCYISIYTYWALEREVPIFSPLENPVWRSLIFLSILCFTDVGFQAPTRLWYKNKERPDGFILAVVQWFESVTEVRDSQSLHTVIVYRRQQKIGFSRPQKQNKVCANLNPLFEIQCISLDGTIRRRDVFSLRSLANLAGKNILFLLVLLKDFCLFVQRDIQSLLETISSGSVLHTVLMI